MLLESLGSSISKHQEVIKEIIKKSNQTLLKVEEIKEKSEIASGTSNLKPFNITKDEIESISNVVKEFPNFNNPKNSTSNLLDQTSTFSEYKNQQENRIFQNACLLRKLKDLMQTLNQVKEKIEEDNVLEDSEEDGEEIVIVDDEANKENL